METMTVTALVERAGRWWTVRVPQVESMAPFQVRSLEQAGMMARKYVADALGLPQQAIRVEVATEQSVLPAVSQALQARRAAIHAVEEASRATRAAIEALLAEGASFGEAAVTLGLSAEEIAELAPRRGAGPAPVARQAPGKADGDVRSSGPLPVRR